MSELVAVSSSLDRVYHFTGHNALQSIMEQGLIVKWVRGGTRWQSMEILLDKERPEAMVLNGIARATGVFAHPHLLNLNYQSAAGAYGAILNGERPVALAVDVDPERTWVFDSDRIDDVFLDIDEGDMEYARHNARKYWDTGMTLATYRRSYDVEFTEHGSLHQRRADAAEGLPYFLCKPEVIVPGPIDPASIEWVASSARRPITMSMPRQVAS